MGNFHDGLLPDEHHRRSAVHDGHPLGLLDAPFRFVAELLPNLDRHERVVGADRREIIPGAACAISAAMWTELVFGAASATRLSASICFRTASGTETGPEMERFSAPTEGPLTGGSVLRDESLTTIVTSSTLGRAWSSMPDFRMSWPPTRVPGDPLPFLFGRKAEDGVSGRHALDDEGAGGRKDHVLGIVRAFAKVERTP